LMGKVAFGASLGATYTNEFLQGVDIIDISEDNVAEGYATSMGLSDSASVGSGGAARWSNLAAMKTLGVLSDQVPSVTGRDFAALLAASRNTANNTSAVTARTIRVRRSAGKTDGAVGTVPRELDTIQAHAPLWGINHQQFQIVAVHHWEHQPYLDYDLQAFSFVNPLTMSARMFQGLSQISRTFATR
jgi:hypothetical protein